MGKAGYTERKTPGAAGKPGACRGGLAVVHAARCLGKTTDFKDLALGIGEHVTVTAVHFNHPGRGGDFRPAEAAAEIFTLFAIVELFSASVVYFVIQEKSILLPEKQNGIATYLAGKSSLP
jgi:hypothetical protein